MGRSAEVDGFMAALDHPLKPEIEALRTLLLESVPGLSEQVKWNAPSFVHGGDDRVTMNLRRRDQIQLIFHRGARPAAKPGFAFADDTGLIRWLAPDRGVATVDSQADLQAKASRLAALTARWVEATSV